MEKSKYESDKRKEELFAEWLDKYFYQRIQNYYDNICRITDKNTQKKGIDVLIKRFDGSNMKIDEKATLYYINQNLPTFAFEVKNRTSGRVGWLFNKDLETDYYLLAWPNSSRDDIKETNNFTSALIMLIKREKIKKLLLEKECGEKKIMSCIQEYQNKPHKTNRVWLCKGISLNFNDIIYEKPINIVISKDILKEYMDALYYVDNNFILCEQK